MSSTKNFILKYLIITVSLLLLLILVWLSASDFLIIRKMGNLNNFSQNNYINCAVILPKNEMYWKEFLGEFEQFAQAQKVLSETIFYESEQEEVFGLKLALFSKFDFVILCDLFHSSEIKSLIDQLKLQKIRVISILNSNLKDFFDTTLGFDYFQKGRLVASNIEIIAKQKKLYRLKIAVITNTINKSLSGNSEVEGIKSYLKEKGIEFSVDLFSIEYGNAESEKLLNNIITAQQYNCYYTTEELETFAFIDSFVKSPKDSNFIFIGAGDDSRLLRYRDEGLIDKLVMPNYDELAIRSILIMKDFEKLAFKGQFIPMSIIVK
ncbi:substrate-binding domain-containing protein [Anaerocellum diazotrophicum]|uniref:Periplasmic binding protein domain-containing protein n=1 Tax=Caldicellulosiruptor diazotrophicus TaxID=2806205 RepID=A0ABM7NJ57_9FIRM|nr:substrate-binding domain-containing protein [Caldicellulosiruptor diazotrophicus]BCS80144.1 hypothetical protein CaldiYA01_01040 [Caldicellulosiruptor diazotrophicus]